MDEKIKSEIIEHFDNLEKLFDIAWDMNKSDYTRTEFTKMVTTYLSGVLQTLSCLVRNDPESKA